MVKPRHVARLTIVCACCVCLFALRLRRMLAGGAHASRSQVPSPAPAAPQNPALQQLCEMGFDGAQAQRALAANNGDLQAAVAALTSGR